MTFDIKYLKPHEMTICRRKFWDLYLPYVKIVHPRLSWQEASILIRKKLYKLHNFHVFLFATSIGPTPSYLTKVGRSAFMGQ